MILKSYWFLKSVSQTIIFRFMLITIMLCFINFIYKFCIFFLFIIPFFNLLYKIEEILLYNFLELFPDKYDPIKTFISCSLFKIFVIHDIFSFRFLIAYVSFY